METSKDSSRNGYGQQVQDRLGSALHRLASLEESVSSAESRRGSERLGSELRRINTDLQRAFVDVQEAAVSYEHLRSSAACSTQRADLLFLLSPVPCLVLDRSGAVVDANPAATRKVNLSHRHLVGKPFQLFVGSDRAEFVKRLQTLGNSEWVTKWPLCIRPRERGSLQVTFAASVDTQDRVLVMLLPPEAPKEAEATDVEPDAVHPG
jgi:PAS domain-containing protein